jgi:hypothetical protein
MDLVGEHGKPLHDPCEAGSGKYGHLRHQGILQKMHSRGRQAHHTPEIQHTKTILFDHSPQTLAGPPP